MNKQSLVIAFLFFSLTSFAQTTTFNSNGNWNDPSKWSNGVPDENTRAIISNNRTCTVNISNARCKSLEISAGNRTSTVFISGSNKLTVEEYVDIEASSGNNYVKELDVANGTLDVGGNITLFAPTDDRRDCILDIGNGTVNLSGNLIMNGTVNRNAIDFTGTGTLNIAGTITGAGDFIEGTGTVNYNNLGNQNVYNTTYNNLTISGSDAKTLVGSTIVNGTLALTNGVLAVSNNLLTINGNVTRNSGSIRGSATSEILVGGTGGTCTLYFDQTSSSTRTFDEFTSTRPNGVTFNDPIEVSGILTVNNNSVINSNGNLTLTSTASKTARVANLSSGTINGNVITQRYVPGGTDRRRWRFFSSPVNVGGNYNYTQFIDDIHVTGAGGSTNGFDDSPNNSSSARTYNESVSGASSNGWANPSVLNTNIPIGRGVSVFVRGSRSTQDPFLNWATPDNVTIDFEGTLNKGDYNISSVLTYTNTGTPTADGFNLIGNPYMSQIDWMSGNISKTNIGNVIYVINPATGAYSTFDVGTQTGVNGGSRYIASSQGFFVRTTGASPAITFRETAKTTSTAPDFFKSFKTSFHPKIRLRAVRNAENMDELVIVLGDTAHKSSVDASDAAKFFNDNNLNFYSRSPQLTNLAINYYPVPTSNDTISLSFFSFVDGIKALGTYSIQVDELFRLPNHLDVFIYDAYVNQLVNLKETQNYVFNLDLNAASAGNDRFKLIFKPDTSTVTRINNFYANVISKKVVLNWNTNTERNIAYYTVEKSIDQKKFITLKPKEIYPEYNSSSYNAYSITDVSPTKGFNYYRVSIVDSSGNIKQHPEVVSIFWDPKQNDDVQRIVNSSTIFDTEAKISIFPNPANQTTALTIFTDLNENNLVQFFDVNGKKVMEFNQQSQEINNIDISNLEKGLYLIRSISETSGKSFNSKFIKE